MSEEEKKAIEITKTIIEFAGDSYIPKENRNALQTLLNLIEKQKKQYQQLQSFHEKDCISKDKIREFIKNELPDDEIMECCECVDVNGVSIREELEKLLEE